MKHKVAARALLRGSTVALLLLTAFYPTSSCSQTKKPMADKYFEDMGLYFDLVIRGKILNVEAKEASYESICGIKWVGGIVTEMRIRINKVVAGEYDKDDIVAYLCEGRIGDKVVQVDNESTPEPHVGDEALIGLNHNSSHNDEYSLRWGNAFFRIRDDQLIPYKTEYFVESKNPMEILERSARKRDFSYLYGQADIVCTARLEDNDRKNAKVTIAIVDLLKGRPNDRSLVIDYSGGTDIRYKESGTQLLVFLKRDGTRYRLSAGMNSIYSIQDGRLFRERAPLVTDLSKAKEIMRKAGVE